MSMNIEIPGKHDIIPIHSSDRSSFKECRRKWDWSSPSRNNLSVRAELFGVSMPLWFGTGVHYALEQYYNPNLQRDPVEAFTEWFDIQWRGGIVAEEWLDRVYDLTPTPLGAQAPQGLDPEGLWDDIGPEVELFRIRGLKDLLPDPDPTAFTDAKELGTNMLTYYKRYAEENDGFEVYAVEHTFSVPIWDYNNDCILTSIDTREQSPNYGKRLDVHMRGRLDAQWLYPNGKRGIIDHKTAARWGEDELVKLESDEQCTNYLYAAEIEAKYYDLPWKDEPPTEIIYNVLRKAYPKPPTELKNGMFSISRETESTTYSILQEWIAQNMPGVPLNEKQQAYIDYLREVGNEQFIVRKNVRRNRHQIANAGKRLYMEALDMLDPNLRIYPNIRSSYECVKWCAFRAPCLAMEDGSDYEQMLRDNYTRNKDR